MNEPNMPVQYRKEALRLLLEHTEGWRLVLERVFHLCKEAEATISNPQWPAAVREDAIGRKNGLLSLIDGLYKEAGILSPFEQHYARLLTALRFTVPREEADADAEEVPLQAGKSVGAAIRRRAGSVA